MIRSIRISRVVKDELQFESLAQFLEAIGLERGQSGEDEIGRTLVFAAPAGELAIVSPKSAGLNVPGDPGLLIQVTDPDTVYSLAKKKGLKIISDFTADETGARGFVVEAPGGIRLAIFGLSLSGASEKAIEGGLNAAGLRFGIVVGRFNSFITDRLLAGALDALRRTGAKAEHVRVVRVPGSFEIPMAARTLAQTGTVHAVICLGCIIRGDTTHYEHIATEVTRGIGQSAQETGVPHAYGVLTCESLEQAIDRAGLKSGNKGFEAALAAVEMASLKQAVSHQPSAVSQIKT